MSATAPPPIPPTGTRRVPRNSMWNRISEGRELSDLWSQFSADAQSSYGFYGKDVDWERINNLARWRRTFHIAKEFFWALVMKMTAARRVLLFLALVMLIISSPKVYIGKNFTFDVNFDTAAALLFLLLLSLELADKVTMKRDLEIAREIQSWLGPSRPPGVARANLAFYTRPQKSGACHYLQSCSP